jgi:hypothetical protein
MADVSPSAIDSQHHAAWWTDSRSRWLTAVGLAVVASGLVHLVVWAVLGGAWEGPVTWRKPILFGISGGLTCLSLGWVFARLPRRWGDDLLAIATAAALAVEVFLIDLQRWRGVASHFNRATPLDGLLYDLMGGLILFVTVVVADLTIRSFSFRRPPAVPADMAAALRAGMVFLLVSCLLGIAVGMHGERQLSAGLEPERYAAAGVPKFPHGVVIHAIQWLPLVAWAAARAGVSPRGRLAVVWLATLGTAGVLVYACMQTLGGRGRFDVTPPSAIVLAAAVACLTAAAVVPAVSAVRLSRRRPRCR